MTMTFLSTSHVLGTVLWALQSVLNLFNALDTVTLPVL